jgi:hypothetical protein
MSIDLDNMYDGWKEFKDGTSIDLSKIDTLVCKVENRGIQSDDNRVVCFNVVKDKAIKEEDYILVMRKEFDGFVIKKNKLYLAGTCDDWAEPVESGWFILNKR